MIRTSSRRAGRDGIGRATAKLTSAKLTAAKLTPGKLTGVGLAAIAAALVLASASGCGGQADTRPASWSYLSTAIVQPSCATASCHSQFTARSAVVLDKIRDGYVSLVCRSFVVPSNPDSSALLYLLRAQGSRRMPP